METKWTKGPWKIGTPILRGNAARIFTECGRIVADVPRMIKHEQEMANAHLIASAPDLYKELAHVLSDLENQIVPGKAAIEFVLRAARGEQ